MLRQCLMCRLLTSAFLVALCLAPTSGFARVYELRTYTTNDGKLDDLHARFRDHTVGLFKKHGMESVGYWVPTDGPAAQNTLIYIIAHKSLDAAKASWKAFLSDPDWQTVYKKSEASGPILAKAPESVYMRATDYSRAFSVAKPNQDAVYELRIYKTNEGKLDGLNARFRDHTIKIFDKYGMQSVGYWTPADGSDASNTLIYILRHNSRDAAKASWKSFSSDPDWKKAAKESQKDGRFLSARPQATYMTATDYSPIR